MDIYDIQNKQVEYDQCLTKGICNLNPNLTSIQEIVLLYLSELSFYVIRLKEFGVENEAVREIITYSLYNLTTNAEYNQDQFHKLISKLYGYIFESKAIYSKYCEENNTPPQSRKSYFKYSKEFTLSDAIRRGEKYFLKKTHGLSAEQKNLYDIMYFLIKSISIKIIELYKLGEFGSEAYYAGLSMLSKINSADLPEEDAKQEIKSFIFEYYKIVKKVFEKQKELYGENEPTDVSFTPQVGKAILISGSDFKKLELVLDAVKETEINVYTHGLEMLMAHTFPKFKNHKNLKGHFGSGLESSLIDFAAFPGPILMTRATLQKVEFFYRGRLFTLDLIAPPGVVRIKELNFEPLIKSALSAKGFTHPVNKPSLKVGFDKQELDKKIDEFFKKFENNQIKNLFIIGLLNSPNSSCNDYFEKFFKIIPKDGYAFSLSYPINAQNAFHPSAFCDYTLFYTILNKLTEKIALKDINLSVFLTRCDKHTISNLLYLKLIGIDNVYTCKCPVSIINPGITQTLKDVFGIKEFANPIQDMNEILSKTKGGQDE